MHIQKMSHALRALGSRVEIGTTAPQAARLIVHSHGDCSLPQELFQKLRASGSEIFHIPFFHGTTAGRMLSCREYLSPAGIRASLREFRTYRRANAAVAVSEIAKKEAERYYFFRKPVAVISNGVDPEIFKPIEKIPSQHRIVFIGRGSDRVKNLGRILQASESVWKKHSDFRILLVPGGENAQPFAETLGPKNSEQLADLFKSVRALILGSLYEADPIVVREAQAVGLPVLASDIPQLRAALAGYENAFYFDPRRPNDVAEKIANAVYASALKPRPRMRTWDTAAQELLKFYDFLGA